MKKNLKRNIHTIIAAIICPIFSSCLWILSEKESYVDDVVENKTDQHVLILGHSSKAVSYSKSLAIPAIPHIDSLSIEPNGQHCLDGYGRGDGCFEMRFERLLNDDYRRQYKYNDTVFFYYPYFDSVEIIFDNLRRIVIVNSDSLYGEFKELDEFWNANGRCDGGCNKKKGICKCTFNYFITDEMYNQAEPIQ